MVDIKKLIVRLSRRGSWRRVALLTERGRGLHDSDHLNGRTLLLMADAKSAEAQQAAEELLPEEERWARWELEELQAEAGRRGVFAGLERDQLLANLIMVKHWEELSAKDLHAECQKRGLPIDLCPDKDELLVQLKQDFKWENMPEEALCQECASQGITQPDSKEEQVALDRTLRSRLRQVQRWVLLPLDQLRKACELRNFETKDNSREDLLDILKSFRILKKAPAPVPAPKPKAEPRAQAPPRSSSRGAGRHQQQRRENLFSAENRADEASSREHSGDEGPDYSSLGLSDNVRQIMRKYPSFSGAIPPDINDWSDKDIEMYLYSNGFLKPKKERKPGLPKVPRRIHYQTLGLPDGAPSGEVRKSYRRLALIYHPDKNLENADEAAEKFKSVAEAYEALMTDLQAKEKELS